MTKQIFASKIDDSKFIEIKVPAHNPTVQDWDEYEVVTGQIQVKDAYYNYVKLKMTRDTLYFVCLPNATKTRLEKANLVVAKEIADVPVNKKGHDAVKKANVLSEYEYQAFHYSYLPFPTLLPQKRIFISSKITDPFIESPGKPPNSIS